jgi:YVTN family beta-propeller protein
MPDRSLPRLRRRGLPRGAGVRGEMLPTPAGMAATGRASALWGRRVISLACAAVVVLATVVTGVVTVALVPASASAATLSGTAYVVNQGANTVTPIDLATNTTGMPIPVGSSPIEVAITPDGKTAYVTNELSNTVTPITVATDTAGTPIPVGNHPFAIAITPDGKTVYVTNQGGGTVTPGGVKPCSYTTR